METVNQYLLVDAHERPSTIRCPYEGTRVVTRQANRRVPVSSHFQWRSCFRPTVALGVFPHRPDRSIPLP
jgi:hypothetical protein